MLGKIFGKKEEKFFKQIDEKAEEIVESMAPAIAEKIAEEAPAAPAAGGETVTAAAPTATSTYVDPKELIAIALQELAAKKAAEVVAAEASTGNFADKYLLSAGNNTPRRRPGLSMSPFMGMAQNMRG